MHYDDMANSCIAKKLELCNYDEICPDGKNHAPSGGQQNANDMWVPINEGTNGALPTAMFTPHTAFGPLRE